MRKIFVLDTSVFAYDANALSSFTNSDVIAPITILDELDKLKKFPNAAGKNARVAIRVFDTISNTGDIHIGIKIDNDIIVKIDTSAYGSLGTDPTYGDNKILACAVKTKEEFSDRDVILVSKDINLRTRARAFGLIAEDYEKDKIESTDLYEGFKTIKNQEVGLELFSSGIISLEDYKLENIYPNECILFTDDNGKGICPGRKIGDEIKLIKDYAPWGLKLRNKEQLFATELIMDSSIDLVSIIGRSGGGKTLVTLACALDLVLNKKLYDNLIIYRPIQTMGAEIGFLPGSLEEKISPYYAPISDAFNYLFSDKQKDGWKNKLHQYIDNGTIQMEALSFIRGRSIPNSLIILDEGQNISKEEIKAILTRAGIGSKVILTGDIEQIDNHYLDATNNGLSYVVEKFKDKDLAGHITFTKGERSQLATLASEIL
jgi:PhoH-like ATPase